MNLERHQQLLGGIIAIFRAGSEETARDLLANLPVSYNGSNV